MIYAKSHKVEDYCYGVLGYKKKKKKICVYVTVKSTNSKRAHTANFFCCWSKHKADK